MTLTNFAHKHGHHLRRALIAAGIVVIVAGYAAERGSDAFSLPSGWQLQLESFV